MVRKWFFFLKEAFLGLRRHAVYSISAVCAISASMVLLGVFFLININVQRVLVTWESRKTVEVFLSDEVSESGWETLAGRLVALPGVRLATYVSKEQALGEFTDEIDADDLLAALDRNPLPASLRLELDEEARNSRFMRDLADSVSTWAGVEEVLYGGRWLERLDRFALGIRVASIVVGLMVALSVVLIVSNTIKLSIVSRKRDIELLRLIGADRDFISLPILIEGVLESLLGALIALVFLAIGYEFVSPRIGGLSYMNVPSMLVFAAFAVLLGWLGSFLSLRSALAPAGASVTRRQAPEK